MPPRGGFFADTSFQADSRILFGVNHSFAACIIIHPDIFPLEAAVALNGISDVTVPEHQRAIRFLCFHLLAVDQDMILGIDTDCRYRGTRLWECGNPLTGIWAGTGVSSGSGSKTGLGILGLGFVNVTAFGPRSLGCSQNAQAAGQILR